jgi:ribonuclease-3
MGADLELLEAAIGHHFRARELLRRALTHKSLACEQAAGVTHVHSDNEQLEFLGDAVLGFLASEALVGRYPDLPEGRLSKIKAHVVSATHLHEVARKIDLGDFLFLGRGEEMSGGRAKRALLANAVEAIIAALYLDGGAGAARDFVDRFVLAGLDAADYAACDTMADFKSALQEAAQARKLPQPRYAIVKERGPEHSKTFTVEVRVGREYAAQAEGDSKKSAGQDAARLVLDQITNSPAGARPGPALA